MGWSKDLANNLRAARVKPKGVLHVGGHLGEECPIYRKIGFKRIVVVEPVAANADFIRLMPDVELHQIAIHRIHAEGVPFWVTSRDTRSSLLRPLPGVRGQGESYVVNVATRPLRDLESEDLNVLVVDVQGSEYDVVVSGTLAYFEFAVVEVRFFEQYTSQGSPADVMEHMTGAGFTLAREYPGRTGKIVDWVFVRK